MLASFSWLTDGCVMIADSKREMFLKESSTHETEKMKFEIHLHHPFCACVAFFFSFFTLSSYFPRLILQKWCDLRHATTLATTGTKGTCLYRGGFRMFVKRAFSKDLITISVFILQWNPDSQTFYFKNSNKKPYFP